jgi:hypothetical protein
MLARTLTHIRTWNFMWFDVSCGIELYLSVLPRGEIWEILPYRIFLCKSFYTFRNVSPSMTSDFETCLLDMNWVQYYLV